MPIAEGKTYNFESEDSIKSDIIETIEYTGNKQDIIYETEEFSAVCPFSGLPDIAKLSITYVPTKYIAELKSLKYYITSYRNVGIYQEAATNKIFNDFNKIIKPESLIVKMVYNIRGGFLATTVMDSKKIK